MNNVRDRTTRSRAARRRAARGPARAWGARRPAWLVVLAAGAVAWGAVGRGECPPEMRRVADGVRYGRRTTTDPRPLELHFLEVDLTSADVALEAVVADDPDGAGPAESILVDPARLASRPGVVAAVNANAFRGLPDASGTASTLWKADMPVTIAGWARSADGDGSLPERGYHQFWIDTAGRAHIGTPKRAVDAAAPAAIAGFHVILADGRFVEGYREKLHPRTVVGTDAAGTRVWLVVVDGRQPGISEGMTYRELAALMRDLGCVAALNLDGGGSTVMLTAGPRGGLEIVNRPSGGRARPVPVMLVVRAAHATPEQSTR
ncbi:MAG: phosphodiester glycosidase family protein [Planctomycetaceae bacterium]